MASAKPASWRATISSEWAAQGRLDAAVLLWTPRWVLLHLIEEMARHAGHADIIREAIDVATCWPVMAAVEGWPEQDWS